MSELPDRAGAPRLLTMPEDVGPVLVQGPVEVLLPDGSVQLSERPVVALCVCRRSRRYPFCDTSHRRHSRPRADPTDGASDDRGVDGSVGKRDE